MPTLGVKVDIDMSTERTRSNTASFYKAFSGDSVRMAMPLELSAQESTDFDLSESNFIIVVADDYGMENEILDITFDDDSTNGPLTFQNVGFLMLNCFNISTMNVKNTSIDNSVEVQVIY